MDKKQRSPLARLFAYMHPFRIDYLLGILYSILNKIFDIFPEILIGVAVDTVVKRQDSWLAQLGFATIKQQLVALGVLTFFIWFFESLFQYLYALKWRNLAQKVQHSLRMDVYDHVQNLDTPTLESKSTGTLLSIINDDVNQLERFLENGINQILQVFVSSAIIAAIFFYLSPRISLLAIIPVPLILWGAFYFQSKLAPRYLNVREKASQIATRLANNISGMFTIKSFVTQKTELKNIERDSLAYQEANRHAIAVAALITPVIRIAILIGFLGTLVYGGFLTVDGVMNVGVFSILVFLTQRLLWPLTLLADITVDYQRSMASARRVFDLLDTPIPEREHGDPVPTSALSGDVSFSNLSFAYRPEQPVLKNLSLTIPHGKTVAFVGTSGSGKTTLLKLLMRFYSPQKGDIRLDGANISDWDLDDFRRHIGIVSQDVFLFEGTVRENIAYSKPDATLDEVQKAAKMAEADEFIRSFPEGYETKIGERGQKLSGGQRQRLAIARAILKNPPILILDEATSAVDNETELAIHRSLEQIVVGRTTLMVAHRLSTIRNADHIFVLKHGEIAEEGKHNDLIKKDGIYAALWRLQTGQQFDEHVLENDDS